MGYCPQQCLQEDLVPNIGGTCEIDGRTVGIDRIIFFNCDVTLPSPFGCAALSALVNSNVLVFTSQLAQIEVQDPEQEELELANCLAPKAKTTRRIINFQDRIKIEQTVASPSANNLFYDYDFWKDKKLKYATMRAAFVMCDGSVRVAKDANGNYMEFTLNMFLAFERQGSGGTAYDLEIKKGQLAFKGDPLDFIKPEVDSYGNVFNINSCNFY